MNNLYTTEAEINKAVSRFTRHGQLLQAEAHRIACSVLRHVGEYRDIHVVRRFLDAMPDMARANALRTWFETFGPVTFDGNVAYFNKAGKTKLGEAIDKPFWKFKANEGEEYQPVNPSALIEALIKKLEKDGLKTGRDHRATTQALKYVPVWSENPIVTPFSPEIRLIEGTVLN
jgi:hypothetical protein